MSEAKPVVSRDVTGLGAQALTPEDAKILLNRTTLRQRAWYKAAHDRDVAKMVRAGFERVRE